MGDLVAEDGGEGVLVVADVEEAAVDEDFAAGDDKGVGCVCTEWVEELASCTFKERMGEGGCWLGGAYYHPG